MNDYPTLSQIGNKQDLKNLDSSQLSVLCNEIRRRIIEVTSKNGGHVGPNLGVVEPVSYTHLTLPTIYSV